MFNQIFILKMKRVKLLLTFLAIVFMFSACEFSPEEIQPVGNITLETDTGGSGEYPGPKAPPAPPDDN